MDLSVYLNKRVYILLKTGYVYVGLCINCDSNSLTLIDKTNSRVQLSESSIDLIKEVGSR